MSLTTFVYHEFSEKRKQSNSNFRKRHLVEENQKDSQDRSKRSRTDLMALIVEELERRYGFNWQSSLPIEVRIRVIFDAPLACTIRKFLVQLRYCILMKLEG